MTTEDGSIQTAQISVAPALSLYRKKLKIIAITALIIGTVGLITYIAVSTALEIKNGEAPRWIDALLAFAVPFAIGLIGYITIARLGKRESKENPVSQCVFYADCFFCSVKSANQAQTHDKFSYSECVLKRENEKYGYIFVNGKCLFLVFGKDGLETEEINTVRKLFGHSENSDTVELKNYKSDEKIQRGIL